jgi:hypothetical protein
MKRLAGLLLAVLLSALVLGCGSDKDKGMNKDRDKPRPGTTSSQK